MTVEIRLLGRFAVTVAGVTVADSAWHRSAAASLVKLLALQPGARMLREQVVDALWPDLLLDEAAPRLHKATHFARAALGSHDALATEGGALVLFPGVELRTDVAAFEEAVARVTDADSARAAAALYNGPLLPDDLYEPWTAEPRDRLRAAWLGLLPRAGMLEELVAADPLDEGAHVALVRSHIDAGRRTAALAALDRMEELLRRALAVEPSEDAREVRRTAEALPVERSGPGTRRIPAARSPLIGREVELAAVATAVDAGRIVTITGPGGAGKSTLALVVARQVETPPTSRWCSLSSPRRVTTPPRCSRWPRRSASRARGLAGSTPWPPRPRSVASCWCWTTASTCST